MERFRIERTAHGDRVYVPISGPELLRHPLYNKGLGFTLEERRQFGIDALLPAEYNDIETQAERQFRSITFNPDPVGQHIDLTLLLNRNEVLFYKVLSTYLETLMPVVYTPTVGEASRYFSHVYRRARGVFVTPEHRGRIEEVLRAAAPFDGVRLMVVTDNEAILGIGDQGVGGMAISVGKLALYCVGAGIHPARTLPVSLDVGTDNQALLEDPLYVGYRQPRLRGDAYFELLDEFVAAARAVFPDVMIQWEDFHKNNALDVLQRYREQMPSFNDDIQGTGAVASACVQAATRIAGLRWPDLRIAIYGAGAAGQGIARQLQIQLGKSGLDDEAVRRAVVLLDSRGVLADDRESLDDYKRRFAWPAEWLTGIGLLGEERCNLASVVEAHGSNVLIGTSGQGGSFDREVVRAMFGNTPQPVILPMSNPTSISEAVPADVLGWTDGRALVASGSPFDAVDLGDRVQPVSQANNVFVFPGIGLGAIASRAERITGTMINAASAALAGSLDTAERNQRCLVPEVSRLWDVCGQVAEAVARQAIADGVSDLAPEQVGAAVADKRWRPTYPELVPYRVVSEASV